MDSSICNFLPVKNYAGSLKTVHFVYETQHDTLSQPFLRPIYYCYLVTGGQGRMKLHKKEYTLEKGTLFFAFPGAPYEIDGDPDFRYLYVSFMGPGAVALLEDLEINFDRPVYEGFSHLLTFWFSAISRVNQINANLLAESVLLYTLSFINNKQENTQLKRDGENVSEMIVDYICGNFTDPELSLAKIADIFNYTEKYLSYLFKNRMGMGFTSYLNRLRTDKAVELMEQNVTSVSALAAMCGYHDSLYFSKVFKKYKGVSPTQYIRGSIDG